MTATKQQPERGAPPGEDSATIDDRHSSSAPVVKAPRYSLAAGVNFSNFASFNLPVPSLAEVLCIAKARPFVGHMKVSPTGDERGTRKGHLCTLLHDAPNVFSAALPNLDVTKRLVVWFLGSRTQYNSAAQSGRLRRLLKTVVEVRCTESLHVQVPTPTFIQSCLSCILCSPGSTPGGVSLFRGSVCSAQRVPRRAGVHSPCDARDGCSAGRLSDSTR